MPSIENSQNRATSQNPIKSPLQPPGLIKQFSPTKQLPFPENTPAPAPVEASPISSQQSAYPFSPNATRPLFTPSTSASPPLTPLSPSPAEAGTRSIIEYTPLPETIQHLSVSDMQTGALPAVITRQLPNTQTGVLSRPKGTTTSLRQSVLIPATGKKSSGTIRPPRGRRWVIQIAVTVLGVLVLFLSMLLVLPIGPDGAPGFSIFQPSASLVRSNAGNISFTAQRAATITAITQDGHEIGGAQNYSGLPTGSLGGNSNGNSFTYGQCTYWADYRYHQLTGRWVPWRGDAYQWVYGATHSAGWVVSSQPHIPSIIVLQPGVQDAGWGYGHVAVVEGYNKDGLLNTSNWNWSGNWGYTTYVPFKPGPGVSFVWYG